MDKLYIKGIIHWLPNLPNQLDNRCGDQAYQAAHEM